MSTDTGAKLQVELAECYILYRDSGWGGVGLKEWATLASRQKFEIGEALLKLTELQDKDPTRKPFIVATIRFGG